MAIPTPTSTLDSPSHSALHNDVADVRMFGAVGDGVTDDTDAINEALDYVKGGAGNGQRLIFPWTGDGYTFGTLVFPQETGEADKWVEIEIYDKLIPTETMTIPARRFSIIGRAGGTGNESFSLSPSAQIDASAITSGSVINLTEGSTSVLLQGFQIRNVSGTAHGILIDYGTTEVRLKDIQVCMDSGNTTGNCWRGGGGFGYYLEGCSFLGAPGGGYTVHLEATGAIPPGDVVMQNCFIANRGMYIKGTGPGTAGYTFRNVLAESLQNAFLTLDSSTSSIAGIILDRCDNSDALQSPACLVKNTGSLTFLVHATHCTSYTRVVESGSTAINGLWHVAGATTSGTTIGQSTNYEHRDHYGRVYFGAPRADVMNTVSSGGVLNAGDGGFFKLTHASPISVTDLLNEVEGQVVEILFTNGNVTIQHGTPIKLAGGANFTGTANDILRLRSDGTTWYEVSRSVNG